MKRTRAGLGYGISAYALWGVLPVYFVVLGAINSFELVSWRILLTLAFCAVLLTITRQWREAAAVLRDRRSMLVLVLASLMIWVNWQVFVIAAASGHVLDASLGYFINPVIVVLIAVLLLGERLTPMQWAAIGATVVAFAVIAIGYGIFPWVAPVLATSFGFYGYFKNRLGSRVGAVAGQFMESLLLTPIAVLALVLVAILSGLTAPRADPELLWLLSLAGVFTGVPLMLFSAAASRLPLGTVGFLQYIAPTLMFLMGWLVLGEEIPPARWIGFGIVWASLVLLSIDTVRRLRRSRVRSVRPGQTDPEASTRRGGLD